VPPTPKFLTEPDFLRLVTHQDHVLSRLQLFEVGATRHHLCNRIRAGLWQSIGPHVVVMHNGPLSEPQQQWAAVQHGGPDAVLGMLSAAAADGLQGFDSPVVHVIAPHGTHRDDLLHPRVRVAVHESIFLGDADVHPIRTPPRTRLPRSVVDAASASDSDRRCRAIIAASVQQQLVRPAHLRALVLRRPTLPRRALVLETVDDVEGGSHSLPELEFLRGLRRAGLPEPARQRPVRRPDGRYYLDADFDPYQVTVEVNGAQHLDQLVKEADDIRRTRLAIGGRLVVDLGSYTVRHDNDVAVLLTADALRSRGWRPGTRVRRRLERMAAATGWELSA